MENLDQINSLEGGLRHLRVRDADEDAKYSVPVETVPRPGFNPTGKEIEVQMNAFGVTSFPTRTVYQYDVSINAPDMQLDLLGDFFADFDQVHIGSGVEKSVVVKKVWASAARKAALKNIIFDGQKLAW